MTTSTHYDVAIIGGGPAGLEAALILSRLRKRILVFDAPEPPRNAASHGVHNFMGLDGLTPAAIREQAWQQIAVYQSAELRRERVSDVQAAPNDSFQVTDASGQTITATYLIMALGFRDIYPAIPDFMSVWGNTVFTCPFCDGYENRDRVWGLVISSLPSLEHMPHLYHHWTKTAKIILSPDLNLTDAHHQALAATGLSVHTGNITEIQHSAGKLEAITLDTGETVSVETLWWRLPEAPQPLTEQMISTFKLALNEHGYLKTDAFHQTSTKNLWAVGDVRGLANALTAAHQASEAAYAISRL